jgi:hypothetical protein
LVAAMWLAHGKIRRLALLFFPTSSIVNISDFLSAVWKVNLLRALEPLTVVLCKIRQFVMRKVWKTEVPPSPAYKFVGPIRRAQRSRLPYMNYLQATAW